MLRDWGIIKWFKTQADAQAYAAANPNKTFIYFTKE